MIKYELLKCTCGGTIADWKYPHNFTCDKCNEEYLSYKLDYDILIPNVMTGWLFPARLSEEIVNGRA